MIQQQTILKVSDNSGAKTVKCIKVLGGFKKKYATIGDTIVVSVRNLRNKARDISKVKTKEIYKALILRVKKDLKKKNGFLLSFRENSVILVNKQGNLIGTRIIGPLPRILKKNSQKLISVSNGLI